MTSTDIEEIINTMGDQKLALMSMNIPTDVAAMRLTAEVAYQLALLNEQIGCVLNTRIAQIAVRVESGEYPLQVQVQEPQRRY